MIDMSQYKEVELKEVSNCLSKKHEEVGLTFFDLALKMKVKSVTTCQNALRHPKKVSDTVLTNAMEVLGVDGFVLTKGGKKKFYIQK
jgi:hypothetical protein